MISARENRRRRIAKIGLLTDLWRWRSSKQGEMKAGRRPYTSSCHENQQHLKRGDWSLIRPLATGERIFQAKHHSAAPGDYASAMKSRGVRLLYRPHARLNKICEATAQIRRTQPQVRIGENAHIANTWLPEMAMKFCGVSSARVIIEGERTITSFGNVEKHGELRRMAGNISFTPTRAGVILSTAWRWPLRCAGRVAAAVDELEMRLAMRQCRPAAKYRLP